MQHQNNQIIISERRKQSLRKNSTDAERTLWRHLRARQILDAKFRRQHAINNYIVDCVSFDVNTIIELDGGQHVDQVRYDATRSKHLESLGFVVLRFWNNDVLARTGSVIEEIYRVVLERAKTHPTLTLPFKGWEHEPALR